VNAEIGSAVVVKNGKQISLSQMEAKGTAKNLIEVCGKSSSEIFLEVPVTDHLQYDKIVDFEDAASDKALVVK